MKKEKLPIRLYQDYLEFYIKWMEILKSYRGKEYYTGGRVAKFCLRQARANLAELFRGKQIEIEDEWLL